MEQWRKDLYRNELYHYGVKGMRWKHRKRLNDRQQERVNKEYAAMKKEEAAIKKEAADLARSKYQKRYGYRDEVKRTIGYHKSKRDARKAVRSQHIFRPAKRKQARIKVQHKLMKAVDKSIREQGREDYNRIYARQKKIVKRKRAIQRFVNKFA